MKIQKIDNIPILFNFDPDKKIGEVTDIKEIDDVITYTGTINGFAGKNKFIISIPIGFKYEKD